MTDLAWGNLSYNLLPDNLFARVEFIRSENITQNDICGALTFMVIYITEVL